MAEMVQECDRVLAKARVLLNEGKLNECWALLRQQRSRTPDQSNALGVCLMRLGEVDRAVEVYRRLVLEENGLNVKPNVNPRYVANFATALLLTGNVEGCEQALREAGDERDEMTCRVRAAIACWKRSTGGLRRLWWGVVGIPKGVRIPLEFAPGVV